MPSAGSFCDVPIVVRFNHRSPHSWVSLDWVINHGLRTRNSQVSGLISLPSNLGIFAMNLQNVSVASSLDCDLELGLDWAESIRGFPQDIVWCLSDSMLDMGQLRSALGSYGVSYTCDSLSVLTEISLQLVNRCQRPLAQTTLRRCPGMDRIQYVPPRRRLVLALALYLPVSETNSQTMLTMITMMMMMMT